MPVQVITHANDEPVTAHRDAEPHAIALEPIDLRMDIRHVHIRARRPPEGSVSRLTVAAILGQLTTGGETTRDPLQKSLISPPDNRYEACTFCERQATPNVRIDYALSPLEVVSGRRIWLNPSSQD